MLRVTWGGADLRQQPLLQYNVVTDPDAILSSATVTIANTTPAFQHRDIQFTPTGATTLVGPFELTTEKGTAATTVTGTMLATDTAIHVASAAGFPLATTADPTIWFEIKVDDEIMQVTNGGSGSTTWTVKRAEMEPRQSNIP